MNWTDLPFCSGDWDVNLDTMKATCHGGHSAMWVAICFCLAIAAILIWRKKVQAKFTLSFVIAPAPEPLTLTTTSFSGQVGAPLSGSVGEAGGTPPLALSVDDPSTLPPGVTVDAQGNVAGTPTAPGTFSVPVTVTDSGA